MNKPTEFRGFIDIIEDLDDGRVVEEMTEQLRAVVRAARIARKKGSVSLKIDITPDGDGRQFVVNATVTPKIPTPTPGMTMFFATDYGELRKDDPRQMELKDVNTKSAAPLRTVGAVVPAGEGAQPMDVDNMKTVIDAAREGVPADQKLLTVEGVPVIVERGNITPLSSVLAIADARAAAPRRRKGTSQHHELASFVAHVNRFKDDDSAVFADINTTTVTAVLDYHPKGSAAAPRWGEHRSVYACPLSTEWKRWTKRDGEWMEQETFAQFIEDHLPDLTAPTGNGEDKDFAMPSEVLTMARNLVVHTKGVFASTRNPVTGEASLICKDEHDTSTSTKIPPGFLLGIPVFEAGGGYVVQARIRMSLQGRARFSYLLFRKEAILRDAFNDVREKVQSGTSLPMFAGAPEGDAHSSTDADDEE